MKKNWALVIFFLIVFSLTSCENTITEEVATLEAKNVILKNEDGRRFLLQIKIDQQGNPFVKAVELKGDTLK